MGGVGLQSLIIVMFSNPFPALGVTSPPVQHHDAVGVLLALGDVSSVEAHWSGALLVHGLDVDFTNHAAISLPAIKGIVEYPLPIKVVEAAISPEFVGSFLVEVFEPLPRLVDNAHELDTASSLVIPPLAWVVVIAITALALLNVCVDKPETLSSVSDSCPNQAFLLQGSLDKRYSLR